MIRLKLHHNLNESPLQSNGEFLEEFLGEDNTDSDAIRDSFISIPSVAYIISIFATTDHFVDHSKNERKKKGVMYMA